MAGLSDGLTNYQQSQSLELRRALQEEQLNQAKIINPMEVENLGQRTRGVVQQNDHNTIAMPLQQEGLRLTNTGRQLSNDSTRQGMAHQSQLQPGRLQLQRGQIAGQGISNQRGQLGLESDRWTFDNKKVDRADTQAGIAAATDAIRRAIPGQPETYVAALEASMEGLSAPARAIAMQTGATEFPNGYGEPTGRAGGGASAGSGGSGGAPGSAPGSDGPAPTAANTAIGRVVAEAQIRAGMDRGSSGREVAAMTSQDDMLKVLGKLQTKGSPFEKLPPEQLMEMYGQVRERAPGFTDAMIGEVLTQSAAGSTGTWPLTGPSISLDSGRMDAAIKKIQSGTSFNQNTSSQALEASASGIQRAQAAATQARQRVADAERRAESAPGAATHLPGFKAAEERATLALQRALEKHGELENRSPNWTAPEGSRVNQRLNEATRDEGAPAPAPVQPQEPRPVTPTGRLDMVRPTAPVTWGGKQDFDGIVLPPAYIQSPDVLAFTPGRASTRPTRSALEELLPALRNPSARAAAVLAFDRKYGRGASLFYLQDPDMTRSE
jgi:hypothetical protein